MTIICIIWMICLELNWFVFDPSWMLHLSEFVWSMDTTFFGINRFNNFLLIDATDRSKISSDQKRFFIALSLYPPHFSRTLPLILQRTCFQLTFYREFCLRTCSMQWWIFHSNVEKLTYSLCIFPMRNQCILDTYPW